MHWVIVSRSRSALTRSDKSSLASQVGFDRHYTTRLPTADRQGRKTAGRTQCPRQLVRRAHLAVIDFQDGVSAREPDGLGRSAGNHRDDAHALLVGLAPGRESVVD